MTAVEPVRTNSIPALCVDLDGTLLRTDSLIESILDFAKRHPLLLPCLPFWAMEGRAQFKRRLAGYVTLDAATFPYHRQLLEYLREQHAAGRKLVLATGADESIARAVAEHLGIFDEVIASDGVHNYSGRAKRQELARRFGDKGYDYAGNSRVDLEVWADCHAVLPVACSASVERRASELAPIVKTFPSESSPAALIKAMRIHQWVKNIIIFLPLIASHRLGQWASFSAASVAFVCFSFCASGAYLLNDLLDLSDDRRHESKRNRPFASGRAPLAPALPLIGLLVAAAFVMALSLPRSFTVVLAVYFAMTLSYSLYFRRKQLVDVFVLAALYTIRMIAGHAAASVKYSTWLLGFCMFIFLSLAMAKRAAEVYEYRRREKPDARGRGYRDSDLEVLTSTGLASGAMAVLILAVYITSPDVTILYKSPMLLLLVCPLIFYWIVRVWLLVLRGHMRGDPVLFALTDRVSYYVAILSAIIVVVATKTSYP
ncbi:MAG: UbiA family prenyltransferase [Tepidisphaeraceae bacterium]|jgi:4-hydroxybenzoate polyprenyltransferase